MKHHPRRCTARCKDGRPCPSWAVRHGDEALCASHRKARRLEAIQQLRQTEASALGFYEGPYSVEQAADMIYTTQAANMKDELRVTRVAVRHTLMRLQQELEPAEFARLIALIFKGAHTIAAIIRVQRSISDGPDDPLGPEIRAAINEISAEKASDSLLTAQS